jgi:hypothetical protein
MQCQIVVEASASFVEVVRKRVAPGLDLALDKQVKFEWLLGQGGQRVALVDRRRAIRNGEGVDVASGPVAAEGQRAVDVDTDEIVAEEVAQPCDQIVELPSLGSRDHAVVASGRFSQ